MKDFINKHNTSIPSRKVLSIDGGGIRGIIPAMVIAHLEKYSGTPARDIFDLIVGPSTGGILTLGLSHPGSGRHVKFSARRMVRLFEEQGGKIFEQSLWRKVRTAGGILEGSYSHKILEAVLKKYFGDATLGECTVPAMVTSYDIERRQTVFLKSWQTQHSGLLCAEAARATSAAPTFFEPAKLSWDRRSRTLIDGAIFMNSPTVSAYAEACELFPDEDIKILSLGTGELTDPIHHEEARSWSSTLRVMSLLDCMFDGVSKAADRQMRQFLADQYVRLQTPLHLANDHIDDASTENIRNLKRTARHLIEREQSSLYRFLD